MAACLTLDCSRSISECGGIARFSIPPKISTATWPTSYSRSSAFMRWPRCGTISFDATVCCCACGRLFAVAVRKDLAHTSSLAAPERFELPTSCFLGEFNVGRFLNYQSLAALANFDSRQPTAQLRHTQSR